MRVCRVYGSRLAFTLLMLWSVSQAKAQPEVAVEEQAVAGGIRVSRTVATGDNPYYSNQLMGDFQLVRISGANWIAEAAQITRLDDDSPLHNASLEPGDIVIRLDGTKVARSRFWDPRAQMFVLPELERHFARTRLRYWKDGAGRWSDTTVNLGPLRRPGGGDTIWVDPIGGP